ncbi:MAG: dehypoxanthine futalosine cyclase [Bacteroidales bacterium]|nr:dehypoxanthine futalosine cyclase [Bacteroidales bacterium]
MKWLPNVENLNVTDIFNLYNLPLSEIIKIANDFRFKINPFNVVTYVIERNINYTNVCCVKCKFCNFSVNRNDKSSFLLLYDKIKEKIVELYAYGGKQILLQGGLNNQVRLSYYINLFAFLKEEFPDLIIHGLSPPEIVFIARVENKSVEYVIDALIEAGLDSLPGGGAEILSDRVRKIISPAKCSSNEWLEVMRIAHKKNLPTSATMMFGHVETLEERFLHLIKIRDLQKQKGNNYGFLSFILWPFQSKNTRLVKEFSIKKVSISEYIRMLALSRIVLYNIPHIQPSWLTMGTEVAQLCLHAGADDMGSIMIEENVVSAAGVSKPSMTEDIIKNLIIEAGFTPAKRNNKFEKECIFK